MILEKIKNIFKPKQRINLKKEAPELKIKEYKPRVKTVEKHEDLPKFLYYDKANKKYKIAIKGVHYGSYNTREEGEEALSLLKENNYDIRVAQKLPIDKVYFDENTRKYIIHAPVDGVEYCFGEYKKAKAVHHWLSVLESEKYPLSRGKPLTGYILEEINKTKDNNETINKTEDNTGDNTKTGDNKTPYHHEKYPQGSYYYKPQYDIFTLPNKQGKDLKITSEEAFNIIQLHNTGYSLKEIYEQKKWTHKETTYSTIRNWWINYQLGKMDLSLDFIIRNHFVDEAVWKK